MKRLLPAALLCLLAAGCSGPAPSRHISRLDKALESYKDLDEDSRAALRDSLAPEITAMMQVLGIDSIDDSELTGWSYSMPVVTFGPAVDSLFSDLRPEEEVLGRIESRAVGEGIELPHRRYVAVVWSSRRSIVFNDSVMLIALNHYLGADNPTYAHWDEYLRRNKNRAHMPYDLAEAIVATAYPYQEQPNAPAINRLLYEGALAHARLKLAAADGGPDALAESLGYIPGQLQWLDSNEDRIWMEMSRRNMIYDTDRAVADRLVQPSPATTIIHPEAPGRAGRYIGYRIVEAYLRSHPSARLSDLLRPGFYNSASTLVESGYKPGNR